MGLMSPAMAHGFFTANVTWETLNSWVTVKPTYGIQGTQQKKKKKKANLKKIELNRVERVVNFCLPPPFF